jgi:hypothetical protein
VQQDDYRPWDVANRAGLMGTPERAAATPGRIENVDFDWHDYTYTWHCRCGRTPSLRHERISDFWAEVKDEPYDRPVWRLVVDG